MVFAPDVLGTIPSRGVETAFGSWANPKADHPTLALRRA